MMIRRLVIALGLLWSAQAIGAEVSFQHEVWPIFKRLCIGCHSELKKKGGLRLDEVAALIKGGKNGPLFFVAGKPDDSLLIDEVTGDEPEMPQNDAPLSRAKR